MLFHVSIQLGMFLAQLPTVCCEVLVYAASAANSAELCALQLITGNRVNISFGRESWQKIHPHVGLYMRLIWDESIWLLWIHVFFQSFPKKWLQNSKEWFWKTTWRNHTFPVSRPPGSWCWHPIWRPPRTCPSHKPRPAPGSPRLWDRYAWSPQVVLVVFLDQFWSKTIG